MRSIFDAELSHLGADLAAMAKHVETAIERATDALLQQDLHLAEQVIQNDDLLDALESQVDERCVLLIAQQQPVGLDLRTVVTSLRISAALERMGDLAQHVAEAARRAYPDSAVPATHQELFEQMAAAARDAASQVALLLESRDLNVAAQIVADDDTLDNLHEQAYRDLLAEDYAGSTQETLDISLLARFFERFGDHAVSVSRRIVYLVTGDLTNTAAAI